MTEQLAEASPRITARFAGFFWLMTIFTGLFAFIAGDSVVVSGNAAATAANMVAHESRFRSAFAANLIATICYLAVTLLVYVLLKPVNRNLSLLAAFFSLTGCAASGASFVFYLAPMSILRSAPHLSVFTLPQLQALALAFFELSAQAYNIGMVFFGMHCLTMGYLIARSPFLPRILGVLLIIAGSCYLTNSFATFLALPFRTYIFPLVAAGGLLGEGSLTLWLLVMGVNAERWKELARASFAIPIEQRAH